MNLLEVRVLLIFIFLDYFTGVLVAISEKKLNSTIGRRGIFNKVGVMICVVICKLIDTLQIVGFAPMLPIVALFFILNEVFSILENLNRLNVPIPYALVSTLKNFQEKSDE
ncbi:phage holin family protein [Anaerovoracaceae bacterium 41-7]|jgi:toxin secretion/phage lysis holin|uniref:phage holin family protein n=1 Tax=Bacillota TaxID=1239 RepID=UPI00248B4E16|nr:phage holin family protein [Thomasclavelia cocleata]